MCLFRVRFVIVPEVWLLPLTTRSARRSSEIAARRIRFVCLQYPISSVFCCEALAKTLTDLFDSFPCNIQVAAFWPEALAKSVARLVRLVSFQLSKFFKMEKF